MARLLTILLLTASSVLAETPSSPAPLPTVDLPPEMQRVLTDYEAAWHAPRDAGALSSLFAEDGFVLSSGHPPVRGRDAIRQYYTGKGGALSLRAFAFATDGSIGYIIGGFSRGVGHPISASSLSSSVREQAAAGSSSPTWIMIITSFVLHLLRRLALQLLHPLWARSPPSIRCNSYL